MAQLDLITNDYFIVSAHREENVDSSDNLIDLLETLNTMAEIYNKKIIVSTHPRTRLRLESLRAIKNNLNIHSLIQFLKPFGFLDYIKLQMNAFCVLSDSGSLTEDASILDFPAITIRQAHERPEGMDVGTLVMSGLKKERVINAIEMVTQQYDKKQRKFAIVPDYDTNNISQKVVRIILSYVDYINRTVWYKSEISEKAKHENSHEVIV